MSAWSVALSPAQGCQRCGCPSFWLRRKGEMTLSGRYRYIYIYIFVTRKPSRGVDKIHSNNSCALCLIIRTFSGCGSGSLSEQIPPEDVIARRTRLLVAVQGMASVTHSIPPSERGRDAVADRRRKHTLTRLATYRLPGSL